MRTLSERASLYIGVKQGSRKHKNIIDYYNQNIKPLPRGYQVKYTDSWCATFVSVILKQCKCKFDIFECSAQDMETKCFNSDILISDKKKGKKNDIIFYDWNGDKWCDHVGIIADISGGYYTIIEGNKDRAVGVRKIKKSSSYIYAIARVY